MRSPGRGGNETTGMTRKSKHEKKKKKKKERERRDCNNEKKPNKIVIVRWREM
jgi:hypothetical protein